MNFQHYKLSADYVFNIVNDGQLSIWLKEQFEKYNITGEAPMLWHFWDDGKVRTVVGDKKCRTEAK